MLVYLKTLAARRISMLVYRKDFAIDQRDSDLVRMFVEATYRLLLKRSAETDQGATRYISGIIEGRLALPRFVASILNSKECRKRQEVLRMQHASSRHLRQEALKVVRSFSSVTAEQELNQIKVSTATEVFIRHNLATLILEVSDNYRDKSKIEG